MFPIKSNIDPTMVYEYITRSIGYQFGQYRNNSELSLREINTLHNISPKVVSALENGKKLPKIELLLRLMHNVGMPYDAVLSRGVLPNEVNSQSVARCIQADVSYSTIKEQLFALGFNRDEIEQITLFMDFIVSKRK